MKGFCLKYLYTYSFSVCQWPTRPILPIPILVLIFLFIFSFCDESTSTNKPSVFPVLSFQTRSCVYTLIPNETHYDTEGLTLRCCSLNLQIASAHKRCSCQRASFQSLQYNIVQLEIPLQ